MNISSDKNISLRFKLTDDKYSNSNKNIKKDFNYISNDYIENWKIYISDMKDLIKISINDNKDKYNEKINDIIKKIENLFNNYINDIKNAYNSQYENILRAYENKIRNLYENLFNLELNRRILEESNKNLLRKEKDFELMKEKTGIIVLNGKIINNSRKENEIFILRKENSILKDIIEKQKQENLQKIKKDSREKNSSNKRLIIKMNNLSLKNKNFSKNLYDSISTRAIKNKKIYFSYPRTNNRFKSDYISNLNNKLKASYKSLLNIKTSKSCQNNLTKNIFNSSKKNKNKHISKFNNNYINIKVQNNNMKIRKISPNNIIKKKLIPKISEKYYKSLNKTKNYQQYLPRNYKKSRYKTSNPSTLGASITNTHRDTSKDLNSYSKKKNKSVNLNDKKINLLNASIIKTIKTKTNKPKGIKYINFLSPTNGNFVNLIPKMSNLLKLRTQKSKFSNSFTKKNNRKSMKFINIKENQDKIKNNYNIKRIILPKKENSKLKNLNVINNIRNRIIPDYKSNIRKLKTLINNSKGKNNNSINSINMAKNLNLKSLIKTSS
jgi:hypothetical protein